MTIGDKVRERRQERHWSQAELAEKVTVTQQMIQRIEKGVTMPGLELAKRLAEAFGCTIDELCSDRK